MKSDRFDQAAKVSIRVGQDEVAVSAANSFYVSCQATGRAKEGDTVLFAEMGDEILGVVRLCSEDGFLVLRGMRVRDDQQHRGIGESLLAAAMARIDSTDIFCLPFAHLEHFYGRAGFKRVDPREVPAHLQVRMADYRAKGMDVIGMRRVGISLT